MAGLWERISGVLGWIPPEDEYLEEDGFLEDDEETTDEWEQYDYRDPPEVKDRNRDMERIASRAGGRVVTLPGGAPKSIRVAVTKPGGFDDVQGIADQLKRRVAVVVNVEQLDRSVARRVVDFLSGTVYSLDGEMQQVSAGVVLFVPREMRIDIMESEDETSGF